MDYVIVFAFIGLLIFLIMKFTDGNRYSTMTDEEYEAEARRASKFSGVLVTLQKIVDPDHHVEYVEEQKEEKPDHSEAGEP